jgi:hypothetical protein
VATDMELDFQDQDPQGHNPSFFYHLGDVVYYDGELTNYYWEFYEPYLPAIRAPIESQGR